MRAEILAAGEIGFSKVIAGCLGSNQAGKTHFYQKHMCHHMPDNMDLGWISALTNVFLIRHPARVIASYAAKLEGPTMVDIGFHRQLAMIEGLEAKGQSPVVIESHDVRADPEAMLRKLCLAIDLPFETAMLSWPAGGHKADGAWAPHWYPAVHRSTGFAGAESDLPELHGEYENLLSQALPYYEDMRRRKIGAALR